MTGRDDIAALALQLKQEGDIFAAHVVALLMLCYSCKNVVAFPEPSFPCKKEQKSGITDLHRPSFSSSLHFDC